MLEFQNNIPLIVTSSLHDTSFLSKYHPLKYITLSKEVFIFKYTT